MAGDTPGSLFVTVFLLASTVFPCVIGARGQKDADMMQPFRVSLSVSPFTEELLASGVTLTDGKLTASSAEELQKLYMAHGANEVYVRINTQVDHVRGHADHSLSKALQRAGLAKKLGLPLNPELGLFGSYGDVRCQTAPDFSDYPEIAVPASWETLSLDQVVSILSRYGEIVARRILATGVEVRIWDLGNEVEFGTAGIAPQPMPEACDGDEGPGWYKPPDGVDPEIGKQSVVGLLQLSEDERIDWMRQHLWPYLGKIFAATASGIRRADPDARFSTHVSGIYATRPKEAAAFFRTLQESGYLPDELGFSFYPSSSDEPGRLARFKETIESVMSEFGRPAFIAEYAYAAEPMLVGGFKGWDKTAGTYPISNEGQASLLHDIASWGAAAGLSGIRPWAPELAVLGWEPLALFRMEGAVAMARPSLQALKDGASHPDLMALGIVDGQVGAVARPKGEEEPAAGE